MKGRRGKAAQTALEYIIVFAALSAVFLATLGLSRAARRAAVRSTALAASEYP